MKARIKKTGEIVNLASYAIINSWGNPIEMKPEEVELIQEVTEDEHWKGVREKAAIAAMQSLIHEKYDASEGFLYASSISVDAVEYADELVKRLKSNQ